MKKTEKVSIAKLKEIIKEEAYKLVGDALSVKMNQSKDKGSDNTAAKVAVKSNGSFEEKKTGPEKGKDPLDVTMNQSKEKGSNKEAAKVAVKKGGSFEFKKDHPAKGEEPTDVDMNQMDGKGGEDKAKTFVEAGSEGKDGQREAKFSEKAKNEKETEKKIADAIVIPESFKNKKELSAFIMSEAKKIAGLL